MALPYRERMQRELARLAAARRRLVHSGRQAPDDVRVSIVSGKGRYVAAAELDHYDRLGDEMNRIEEKLPAVPGTERRLMKCGHVIDWPSGVEQPPRRPCDACPDAELPRPAASPNRRRRRDPQEAGSSGSRSATSWSPRSSRLVPRARPRTARRRGAWATTC